MTTATIPRLMTAEDFAMMPRDDMRHELVNGEVIELSGPPMPTHGRTQAKAASVLARFAERGGHGEAFIWTGFLISRDPDTVRAPDVAFILAGRLPDGDLPGYLPFAPDIAVEVVSPSDTPSAAHARALMWLDAGSVLVWMLFPESRSVTVYRADGEIFTLGEDDILDAAPVLDGFSVKVSELFRPRNPRRRRQPPQ